MTNVRAKLAELGLEIPVAAKPIAAYVPAVRTGNLVFTAGQLPLVNGKISLTGKVGGAVSVDEAKALAQICALNCLGAVETVANVDDIIKIVRVVGYVNGVPGFINQPAVVNGVSELFLHIWGEEGKHARSAVGIAELPMDSPVEVELTVELRG
ncbi:MAG: RidA family protein [Candidatus Nanopelagicaceae bacterium]